MRYIQPKITGSFAAQSAIQGPKLGIQQEVDLEPTPPAAYEADE